jgi:hypothetical protein
VRRTARSCREASQWQSSPYGARLNDLGRKNDTEPVVLMEKELAAKTVEPLVTRIFDQLASDEGLEAIQALLPIDVGVTIVLRSGDRLLAAATFGSRVEDLQAVS